MTYFMGVRDLCFSLRQSTDGTTTALGRCRDHVPEHSVDGTATSEIQTLHINRDDFLFEGEEMVVVVEE